MMGELTAFKFVFSSVLGMMLVSILGLLLLAYVPPPRDNGLPDTLTTVLKLCAGAACGLLGGRTTA